MGQINPHFLYNTLENIVWKSNEVGRPDIGRIAAALGRLYRLSIGNGKTIVPIRQEVEHVMAYVNIQKNRYKERIEFDSTVDYDQLYNYAMIKLTLQPQKRPQKQRVRQQQRAQRLLPTSHSTA